VGWLIFISYANDGCFPHVMSFLLLISKSNMALL